MGRFSQHLEQIHRCGRKSVDNREPWTGSLLFRKILLAATCKVDRSSEAGGGETSGEAGRDEEGLN